MKKFFPILLLISSCSTQSDKANNSTKDTLVKTILPVRHFQIDPSNIFGQYAINCNLVSTDSNPNLFFPKLNDTLKFAIDSLYKVDTTNLKIWTALILLKEYSHHLDCCHQSYEARVFNNDDMFKSKPLDKENNYILYTFLKLTNQLSLATTDTEFFGSGFIYSYLTEHTELANNKLIEPYFTKVDKAEKKAEQELKQRNTKEKNGY